MIREGIDKNDFANRMNQMFKVAEKECVVESFRKKENKMNHNCHFSKWLKDSPVSAMNSNNNIHPIDGYIQFFKVGVSLPVVHSD